MSNQKLWITGTVTLNRESGNLTVHRRDLTQRKNNILENIFESILDIEDFLSLNGNIKEKAKGCFDEDKIGSMFIHFVS